jgi:uracil-DNA glycosylase family 4
MTKLDRLFRRDCELCPLHLSEGLTCLGGSGNIDDPKLMVVGDAPSKQEVAFGRAFMDQRGTLLKDSLKEAGIPVGADGVVYCTYLVKCFPAGKIKIDHANTCYDTYLAEEIFRLKPSLIITLGKKAQAVLTGVQKGLNKTHGRVLEVTFERQTGEDEKGTPVMEEFITKVIPIEHPYSILTSPSKKDPWLADLRRCKAILYNEGEPFWTPDKLGRFDFQVIESIRHLKAVCRELLKHRGEYLVLDVEASGLDEDINRDDFRAFTLQFGLADMKNKRRNDAMPVYILPLQSTQFPQAGTSIWLDKCIGLLNNLLDPRYFKLVAHNGKYDLKVLRRIGVNTPYLWWDTMILWANAHGEASMSLKEIAYQVSDLGGYEVLMNEYFKEHGTYDAPPELLVPYGGLDVVVTRHLLYDMHHTILTEVSA